MHSQYSTGPKGVSTATGLPAIGLSHPRQNTPQNRGGRTPSKTSVRRSVGVFPAWQRLHQNRYSIRRHRRCLGKDTEKQRLFGTDVLLFDTKLPCN